MILFSRRFSPAARALLANATVDRRGFVTNSLAICFIDSFSQASPWFIIQIAAKKYKSLWKALCNAANLDALLATVSMNHFLSGNKLL